MDVSCRSRAMHCMHKHTHTPEDMKEWPKKCNKIAGGVQTHTHTAAYMETQANYCGISDGSSTIRLAIGKKTQRKDRHKQPAMVAAEAVAIVTATMASHINNPATPASKQ